MVTSNSMTKMLNRRNTGESAAATAATHQPSSVASGFRLLDGGVGGEPCETVSTISRNSIYKLKIDSMFDDSRSVISTRVDDRNSLRGDRRGSLSLSRGNGGGGAASTSHAQERSRGSLTNTSLNRKNSFVHGSNDSVRNHGGVPNGAGGGGGGGGGRQINNVVQAQIERMFTEVSKDATSCSFPVRCLGSLPLHEKVTNLHGLQEPLRQLYLSGAGHGNQNAGNLDIFAKGVRVRLANGRDPLSTPFHNIAVWSAVKFVVSPEAGGAAFLPLITDPENIDKTSLFFPLSAADKRRLSSGLHSPLFAVVMRSSGVPKRLECHGFVCQTPEDAIVIAATLYQSLMAHMGNSQNQKNRRPRNRNGVSCVSIASSTATNNLMPPTHLSLRKSASHSSLHTPQRPPRKKRSASSSLSGESDSNRDILVETSTDERKKKSSKSKRAPPAPNGGTVQSAKNTDMFNASMSYLDGQSRARAHSETRHRSSSSPAPPPLPPPSYHHHNKEIGGDILTRVAIPRSGSFLNTGGLSRYKSRGTRKTGKTGGGGSPLGFSELFNEFRLQENLHSLDEILNAIINSDGMSFNDLKPIYKEFLLKLAVTLTKDELYQRSKSIMRRQKKKKLRRKNSNVQNQRKKMIIGAKGLRRVFAFGKFRSKKSSKKSSKSATSSLDIQKCKKSHHKTGTSGSDVSVIRNEHTLSGQNRNSSSGYVSCSECSYDSEACTCASAERCYCSLGDNDLTAQLKKRAMRDSLITCHTDDKCYCSLEEGKVNTNGETSETTWCDSDSCLSTSKCYCPRDHTKKKQHTSITRTIESSKHNGKSNKKPGNNLGLDYELFTVGGNGRPVNASEALSVKKSVEMAALFADVKLSQTTDIQSLVPDKMSSKNKHSVSSSSRSKTNTYRSNNSSTELLLRREFEKPFKRNSKSEDYYQALSTSSQRPVSSSLEDSLGYLP